MGAGPSKPAPSSTQHVFKSETPVRFSQDLVDALQASPETDGTRAKDLELHIQRRVADELSRLDSETSRALEDLETQISATPNKSVDGPSSATQVGVLDHGTSVEGEKTRDLSRAKVQTEIATLKQKLQDRKLREDVVGDKKVEKAKADVIRCLRINDRRPLDCWKEVEGFKREVGRLEGAFLGSVLE